MDPDGTFRSIAVQDFCDRNHILLDIIPVRQYQMKAIWGMHTGEFHGECQTTLVARILEFLDHHNISVARSRGAVQLGPGRNQEA